ncbi:hypothetical protein [Polynucleobacter brandtiae]|uniref:Entry exclusion lipoprotein TrbK n=1 Tax=Polynucleobacter brandtiae TaxID=1938816 RepID=A0A2M8VR42_9BURK|nr:hypothetical protein [Polynucleobacter brandtiae]PJI79945.1 hypothetical protein B0G85_0928 [Polynucleobacter brandtiae]
MLGLSTHQLLQKRAYPIIGLAMLAMLAIFALAACTSYPDVNQDPAKNNRQTFQRDALECAQAYPDAGSGVHVRQRIDCMKLKGWR